MTTLSRNRYENIQDGRVGDVMSSPPVTTTTTATLSEAACQMRDAGIGDVIVLEGDRIWGILTDRDIVVRAIAEGRDPACTRVAEVTSRRLTTVSPDDGVDHAIALMREHAVRRLPVVKDDGRPVGVVSLGDLALERDPDSCLGQISAAPPNV